mgnify:CR=1 FL=1
MKITKLFTHVFLVAVLCSAVIAVPAAMAQQQTPLGIGGSGSEGGNGGGAWVCRTPHGAIQWLQVVDVYEAALRRDVAAELYTGEVREIVDRVMLKLSRASRELYEALAPRIDALQALEDHPRSHPPIIHMPDRLDVIEDALHWLTPETVERCEGGTMAYEQVVNYRNDGDVWVQSTLFQALPTVERAALVVHEAVYAHRRARFQDRDSVNTRRVVGLLFARLTAEELGRELVALSFSVAQPRMCTDLSDEQKRAAPVGFTCRTSSGFVFERIADTAMGAMWLDQATHLLWAAEPLAGTYRNDGGHIENGVIIGSPAQQACRVRGCRLPRREEFITAEAHGFREILLGMSTGYFWSSSVHPNDSDSAYAFVGRTGSFHWGDLYLGDHNAVRCVSPR